VGFLKTKGEGGGVERSMTFNTKEKLKEILGGLSSGTIDKVYDELHEVLCKSIMGLLQDSIAGPGVSQQQIKSAKEFAELKPDTEAAKEVFEYLDSEEVKEALIRAPKNRSK
jgi:hypothetical protein